MSVKLECDRCGAQETTGSVMLLAGTCGPGIPTARPELPDGWTRPRLPHEDDSAWDRELCPSCTADLRLFMGGALRGLKEALESLRPLLAMDSRDWSADSVDARLWGVLVGWDCEEDHEHDDLCSAGGLEEIAKRFGWGAETLETVRRRREAVARVAGREQVQSRQSTICPDCGHLRHSVRCPDQVSEVGSCGCLELTPANELKELGIDSLKRLAGEQS